jgi:hypothetical protein
MLLGNFALAIAAVAIAQRPEGALVSAADVVYWLAVAGMVAARYADIRFFGGKTSDGRPATMSDWGRYTLIVAVAAAAVWAVVRLAF